MSLKIRKIADPAVENSERVIIDVLANVDCGYYALCTAEKMEAGKFFPSSRRFFWFPDRDVKKGDVLVVYSKPGQSSQRKEPSGSTIHFFYWGFPKTLFNGPSETVMVMELTSWSAFDRTKTASVDEKLKS